MALAMARPWKHPKTGVFYLRVKVPRDVVSVFGTELVKQSLRTKDEAAAKSEHTARLAELHKRWAQLRTGVQSLSHRQVEALAGEVYQAIFATYPGDMRNWIIGAHTGIHLVVPRRKRR
ncbi:DUF6538 domain-containing protein [Aquabacter sp. CN5-332]|uniref:DUF6538 domain-containing protein n=1 Tax=Aquabacter sp. CN5-332 TaxID=3156608 RepID=UPI0032B4D02A